MIFMTPPISTLPLEVFKELEEWRDVLPPDLFHTLVERLNKKRFCARFRYILEIGVFSYFSRRDLFVIAGAQKTSSPTSTGACYVPSPFSRSFLDFYLSIFVRVIGYCLGHQGACRFFFL